jgi:hypothetical protein
MLRLTTRRKVFYAVIIFFVVIFAVQISEGQQGEEEILGKLLVDSQKIIINVGSRGCTGKNHFRIDIKKEPGVGKAPHYMLGIYRIKRDECKAIVPDGIDLVFDFNKDMGLSGIFTISIKNKIDASRPPGNYW